MVSSLWHRPVASLRRSSAHIHRWFQTPVGQEILAQELELIDLCRQEYKGEVMAQISGSGQRLLGQPSRKRQKIVISAHSPSVYDYELYAEEGDNYSWIQCDNEKIPLEDGSIDFLVLHHVLEFSENPHSALREAARVLAPHGNLVLICFNPYSLFGLRKSLQLVMHNAIPWAHHGLSCKRVSDWLQLTSCYPINTANGFYAFPFQWRGFLRRMAGIDRWLTRWGIAGGGFYVIHACKEVMTPIKTKKARQAPRLIEFPTAVSAANTSIKSTTINKSKTE